MYRTGVHSALEKYAGKCFPFHAYEQPGRDNNARLKQALAILPSVILGV